MPDYGSKNYNCLAGCADKYKIEPIWDKAPFEVIAESFAPVVIATMESTGTKITVGNESFPSNENKAVIKSLEFNFTNKMEGSMEIVDEEGGALTAFLNNTINCAKQLQIANVGLEFKIGWVYSTCDGVSRMDLSPIVRTNLLKLETNLSSGLIRFNCKFGTADNIIQTINENKVLGEQKGGKKMSLEEAIVQLMEQCPSMNVEFGYYDQKGELKTGRKLLKWLAGGSVVLGGPKSFWQSDRQDRFAAIAKWVEPFRIKDGENDKGIVMINDPSRPNTLLILQDPNPEKINQRSDKDNRHIGTFIVNGGKCSNVLEFNPTFNFQNVMSSQSSGGNTKGGLSSDNELKETTKTSSEKKNCDTAGIQTTITLTQQIEDVSGKEASAETNKSQNAHIKANTIFEIQGDLMSAELRIVGSTNSAFYGIPKIGAPMSIVVINPFTIRGGKAGDSCGDFLKKSDCNQIFSNSRWAFLGASHSIKEGSFTTIIKTQLVSAPQKLEYGVPLGGDPAGFVLRGC